MPENADTVQGWDFEQGCTLDGLLSSFLQTGFQATAFGRAVAEVNRMVGVLPSHSSQNCKLSLAFAFEFKGSLLISNHRRECCCCS